MTFAAPGGSSPASSVVEGLSVDQGAPILPDYSGACIANVMPALLEHPDAGGDWMPLEATGARQVVLLVLDGLGWQQLTARPEVAPTLTSMGGRPILTVVPSTTSTALTSIVTGRPPGQHGIVGYRIAVHGEVLNVLRWSTAGGDARERIVPEDVQRVAPFGGRRPPVVSRTEFAGSGFTRAHLVGARLVGYRVLSSLVVDVAELLGSGERFVYAYYDGVDKVAHEYGLGRHFEAELRAVDQMVADLVAALPAGAALVVTADHGQVDVGDNVTGLEPEVLRQVSYQSGEARFRWLHAKQGAAGALLETATQLHGADAWVRSREQVVDDGWLGPVVTRDAAARLGDVALVPRGPSGFLEPTDTGPLRLIARHGGLSSDEMLVPLLWASG